MEFLDSLKQVNANWQPYKKWEAQHNDMEFQRQELYKSVPTSKEDLEKASQYGRTLIDSINIMDQYSINKAEDVELFTNLGIEATSMGLGTIGFAIGAFAQSSKNLESIMAKNKYLKPIIPHLMTIGAVVVPLIFMPYFYIKAKHYEKEASRVARHDARETELKNPKHFVIYNEEQLERAKKLAKSMPDLPDKQKKSLNPITNYHDSLKSIKEILKNHDEYKQKRDEDAVKLKKKLQQSQNTNYTQEQLKDAKRDQDNLQRIIRKIETNSQNYLNNAELAMDITLCSSALSGYVGGKLVVLIMKGLQKFDFISKNSNFVNKAQRLIPGLSTLAVAYLTGVYAIKIQKEAAKIGRYKAKKDLLSEPNNFINYTDEQLNSVKNLKSPIQKKSLSERAFGSFKSALQLFKDYKEYETYQKTVKNEEEKLDKALMQMEVTPQQLKNAKALQENVFMSFEKMDEKTQRYTDDMEAATDIGKTFFDLLVSSVPAVILFINMTKELNNATKEGKHQFMSILTNGLKKSWIPFAISGLLEITYNLLSNELKKKSGRIGVMEAINELQDPRLFVNNAEENKL